MLFHNHRLDWNIINSKDERKRNRTGSSEAIAACEKIPYRTQICYCRNVQFANHNKKYERYLKYRIYFK